MQVNPTLNVKFIPTDASYQPKHTSELKWAFDSAELVERGDFHVSELY